MAPWSVYLLTFNCARTLVDIDSFTNHFFGPMQDATPDPDLIVLSLQEIAPIAHSFLGASLLDPYFSRFEQAIAHLCSVKLEHVLPHNNGMTALMIFSKPDLASTITSSQMAQVGVGEWGLGNKGAVGARLNFQAGRSVTFVAAHLAPFEDAWERRNRDWEAIVQGLVFTGGPLSSVTSTRRPSNDPSQATPSEHEQEPLLASSSATGERHTPGASGIFVTQSPVFLAGDLNYRTSDTFPVTDSHLTYPQPQASGVSSLLALKERDQLERERSAGRTFHQLHELPVDFPPTYKYSVKQSHSWPEDGTEPIVWHWAKHRFPSWCDRVLFSSYLLNDPSVFKAQSYHALPLQRNSDHRPVGLAFELDLDSLPPTSRDVSMPFSIDPSWSQRRATARRNEIVVGVIAYLGLTWEGNGLLLASAAGALGGWLLYSSTLALNS